jgi:endonuclease YncB( thermonuclease family)
VRPHYYEKPRPRRRGWRGRLSFSQLRLLLILGFAMAAGYHALGAGAVDRLFGTSTQSGDVRISFSMCGHGGLHHDCVIDGDTFYLGSQSIRVADIDAPETHPPRCDYEASLGARATNRLLSLLNAGPFTLQTIGSRDRDRYGRLLRVVIRGGRSLGGILVSEGLARPWTGHRRPWCV